jgi:hypothetical protein
MHPRPNILTRTLPFMFQYTLQLHRFLFSIHLLNERKDEIQSCRDLHCSLAHLFPLLEHRHNKTTHPTTRPNIPIPHPPRRTPPLHPLPHRRNLRPSLLIRRRTLPIQHASLRRDARARTYRNQILHLRIHVVHEIDLRRQIEQLRACAARDEKDVDVSGWGGVGVCWIDAVPKTRIHAIQRWQRRFDFHGVQRLGYEREIELLAKGEVPEGIERAEDVDGVEGGEEGYGPVFGWRGYCGVRMIDVEER